MNLKNPILFFMLSFFFMACTSQPYLKENSAFIVFKTSTFKYADMGFVYENTDEVKVEIYGSGQPLMSLKIFKDLVCMGTLECMDKESFNGRVLHESYPTTVLDNAFRGKAIFSSQGLLKMRNGFTQKIVKKGKYSIDYRVLNNDIIFRDKMNTILIKVKKQ